MKGMKARLLKDLRRQAYEYLHFRGRWSGYWRTTINGKIYESDRVSGLKYVLDDNDDFIRNSILSACKELREKKHKR